MSTILATREAIRLKFSDRNRAVIEAAQWFAFDHLPVMPGTGGASPRDVSASVASLAFQAIDLLPDTPELTHALRRLLEAKDCLVRAAIAAQEDDEDAQ